MCFIQISDGQNQKKRGTPFQRIDEKLIRIESLHALYPNRTFAFMTQCPFLILFVASEQLESTMFLTSGALPILKLLLNILLNLSIFDSEMNLNFLLIPFGLSSLRNSIFTEHLKMLSSGKQVCAGRLVWKNEMKTIHEWRRTMSKLHTNFLLPLIPSFTVFYSHANKDHVSSSWRGEIMKRIPRSLDNSRIHHCCSLLWKLFNRLPHSNLHSSIV